MRGFMLGKFMPPHAGHLLVAETGAAMVERMTVLVCSLDREPIPGALRARWMRELLPGCRVVHMHRDIPQEPAEHPRFWPIWSRAVREFHPEPIDRVFASEPYVFRLAQVLDATPVLVDPLREVFAVSGSAIRGAPEQHWNHLPAPVRRWLQRRVCLLGPESTGKSTLAGVLARAFDSLRMPEYGRTYDAHYRRGSGWRKEDFVAIAATHTALREALAPRAGPLFFEDTDALQTAVWAQFLGAALPLEELAPGFEPAHLYLLLAPDVAFRDDGTRYFEDTAARWRFYEACHDLLRARGHRFATITGADWAQRERQAIALVDAYRAEGVTGD